MCGLAEMTLLNLSPTEISDFTIFEMGVSENSGTPKSSILVGFSHYKSSILGYPYFWKHPNPPDSARGPGFRQMQQQEYGDDGPFGGLPTVADHITKEVPRNDGNTIGTNKL